jgi:hypothetical protein
MPPAHLGARCCSSSVFSSVMVRVRGCRSVFPRGADGTGCATFPPRNPGTSSTACTRRSPAGWRLPCPTARSGGCGVLTRAVRERPATLVHDAARYNSPLPLTGASRRARTLASRIVRRLGSIVDARNSSPATLALPANSLLANSLTRRSRAVPAIQARLLQTPLACRRHSGCRQQCSSYVNHLRWHANLLIR